MKITVTNFILSILLIAACVFCLISFNNNQELSNKLDQSKEKVSHLQQKLKKYQSDNKLNQKVVSFLKDYIMYDFEKYLSQSFIEERKDEIDKSMKDYHEGLAQDTVKNISIRHVFLKRHKKEHDQVKAYSVVRVHYKYNIVGLNIITQWEKYKDQGWKVNNIKVTQAFNSRRAKMREGS